jgi:hypothetical protein
MRRQVEAREESVLGERVSWHPHIRKSLEFGGGCLFERELQAEVARNKVAVTTAKT